MNIDETGIFLSDSAKDSGMEEYRTDEFQFVGWVDLDSRGRANLGSEHAGKRARICVIEIEDRESDD